MVSCHKQGGKGFIVQPIHPVVFLFGAIPDAKIPANDHIIIFAELFLLGKNTCAESGKLTMCVSRNENHTLRRADWLDTPSCLCYSYSITPTMRKKDASSCIKLKQEEASQFHI